ncbi:hypothetical protein LOTGIDRAFT_171788 [Lottia gigantea]|uniref:Uncharacterized protein n=1 Tax=Lottia gigantea TaxID=225164 RepID=V4AFB2_LOTGI|nr:hypothetical protein LOTGIDRAFT_171788 [Lottia gigantea]ESP02714.1 hypothetical protein LOTGIDRAFT_171788 [Lottia gigantea]
MYQIDTNITGPSAVLIGTNYNVTCTLSNNRGTFFRNNMHVTDAFINDTSERCYVTISAKYECYCKKISTHYNEFQLVVPTGSGDIGETGWYCSYSDGKSNTIFVDVFQPTEYKMPGNQKWSTKENIIIASIPCSLILLVALTVLVVCKIKIFKSKKMKNYLQEMTIDDNSLYHDIQVDTSSRSLNTESSTEPIYSQPQKGPKYMKARQINADITELEA